jgi:hypothetical protein
MALSNYTELKTAVASWLNRSDLASVVPDFITLAEAQMNRRLRVRNQITRAEASISAEYTTVPADFAAPKQLTLETSESDIRVLDYLAPERLLEGKAGSSASGEPMYWTVVGGEIQVHPIPEQTYTAELVYFAKLPALSMANASNWLLAAHPDAYLYGALVQAAPYLVDDHRSGVWGQLFLGALGDIERADRSIGGKLRTELGDITGAGFNIGTGT